MAICSAGYNFQPETSDESEFKKSLRNFLRQGMGRFPNTSSRVVYNSSGNDKVIHNVGTSEQYCFNANVVGEDGWISNILNPNVLESLLERNDVKGINNIFQWINGTNGYIWRLNKKPLEKNERVVRFIADSNRLGPEWARFCSFKDFSFLVQRLE